MIFPQTSRSMEGTPGRPLKFDSTQGINPFAHTKNRHTSRVSHTINSCWVHLTVLHRPPTPNTYCAAFNSQPAFASMSEHASGMLVNVRWVACVRQAR